MAGDDCGEARRSLELCADGSYPVRRCAPWALSNVLAPNVWWDDVEAHQGVAGAWISIVGPCVWWTSGVLVHGIHGCATHAVAGEQRHGTMRCAVMGDIFISYASADGDFADWLTGALRHAGLEVWRDIDDVGDAEPVPVEIRAAIERCLVFLFVITRGSVASRHCREELEHATAHSKRVITVARDSLPTELLPPDVRHLRWIPFDDGDHFEDSFERLLAAVYRDREHVRNHTRWLVRSREWEDASADSALARGADLVALEEWLASCRTEVHPHPTPLQRAFALESRRAMSRRARRVAVASCCLTAFAITLVVLAAVSRARAQDARTLARAQALSATANDYLRSDPLVSLTLATRAVEERPIPQARSALRAALDASPLLADYPPAHSCPAKRSDQDATSAYRPGFEELLTVDCAGLATIYGPMRRVLRKRSIDSGPPKFRQMAFSPDGAIVVVKGDHRWRIVDARSLRVRRTVRLAAQPFSPTFTKSNELSYVTYDPRAGNSRLEWLDVGTGRHRVVIARPFISNVVALPRAGALVASTNAGYSALVDPTTGRVRRRIRSGGTRYNAYFNQVAASPDGALVAISVTDSTQQSSVQLWRTRDWKVTRSFVPEAAGQVTALAFSPDSTRLLIGLGDGTSGIWLVPSAERLATFGGQGSQVTAGSFAVRGTRVAITTSDGFTRLWRAGGPERFAVDTSHAVSDADSLAIDDDTVRVLDSSSGRVRSWTLSTGRPGRRFDLGTARYIELSDNGHLAVKQRTSRSPLTVLSMVTGRRVGSLPRPPFPLQPGFPALAYAPDDRTFVAFAGATGARGLLMRLGAHRGTRLALPPGASVDWTTANVAFSPDSRAIIAGDQNGLYVWSAGTGRLTHRFPGVTSYTRAVAINALGTNAVAGANNGSSTLVNFATGRAEGALAANGKPVFLVAFADHGRSLITEGDDRTLRVWDLDSRTVIRQYTLSEPQVIAVGSTSGQSTATLSRRGVLRVFDACGRCRDTEALLTEARRRGSPLLNPAERRIVDQAVHPPG